VLDITVLLRGVKVWEIPGLDSNLGLANLEQPDIR
jgi:hypothetical protein